MLFFAACLTLAPACVGIFADDGGSVSLGSHRAGAILRAAALPAEGPGFRVHAAWRGRDRLYGTQELVVWLRRAFRAVDRVHPGSVAWVGDLSRRAGGRSPEHRSHESGRDVDIFFFAVDDEDRPYHPGPAMLRFRPNGRAFAWSPADDKRVRAPVPAVRFDVQRNWALVRALVADPTAEVQWIFIHRALGALMLEHAAAAGEDPALVARAAALFHQPTDAQAHDDHMHVRIFCPPLDRSRGCVDRGPQRWWKKRWKYMALAPLPDGDDDEVAGDLVAEEQTAAARSLGDPVARDRRGRSESVAAR